jgi:tetratricopeptide (TPR) repeat protein
MKIAVYTIALNEEKHVERWAKSAEGADCVMLVDTGSSDNTTDKATFYDVCVRKISISPWRFDDARNAALALLPADIDVCVSLDMDEVLVPGWREKLEKAWTQDTTRLRYKYVWNHNADGSPGLTFYYDHIHSRHGYRWKSPVHESLARTGSPEVQTFMHEVLVEHWADNSKVRDYLPLLEIAVAEDPSNDRNAHYLGREYMYRGRWDDAERELIRHLNLPSATWAEERSASMQFLARCAENKGDHDGAKAWYQGAVKECASRDSWYAYAKYLLSRNEYQSAFVSARTALAFNDPPLHYNTDAVAWSYGPADVAAVAAHYMGEKFLAQEFMRMALNIAPLDDRLIANSKFILKDAA